MTDKDKEVSEIYYSLYSDKLKFIRKNNFLVDYFDKARELRHEIFELAKDKKSFTEKSETIKQDINYLGYLIFTYHTNMQSMIQQYPEDEFPYKVVKPLSGITQFSGYHDFIVGLGRCFDYKAYCEFYKNG